MCFNVTKWTRGLLDIAVSSVRRFKNVKTVQKDYWEHSTARTILFLPAVFNSVLMERSLARSTTNKNFKVARYSFSGSIPSKFERKLRRHEQRLGEINTTVVLDKNETLLWSGLQWHRSCHSNEMTPLPILLAAVFLGTGNCSSKTVYWSFLLQ